MEDGGSGLASLKACFRRRLEDLSSGGSLNFMNEPSEASSRDLDNSVSNEYMPSYR